MRKPWSWNRAGSTSGAATMCRAPALLQRRTQHRKIAARRSRTRSRAGQPARGRSMSGSSRHGDAERHQRGAGKSSRLRDAARDSGTAAARAKAPPCRSEVDQEAAAPAEAKHVGTDQQSADHLSAGRGKAEHHAICGERPRAIRAGIDRAKYRQHLRCEQCGADALCDASGHQQRGVRGQAAQPPTPA